MTGLATIVYALCFLSSVLCAVLLFRSFKNTGRPLLFWTAVSFIILSLNNLLLLVDLSILHSFNLVALRQLSNLTAAGILIFAFIYKAE